MAVNFTKNQDELTKAWRKVVDSKDSQQWALFGYEGNSNIIKLMSTGSNGLKELVREFNCSLIQYAFCRVLHDEYGINKLILINWQGDSSPLSRKGLCASHVGDIANYFKGCTQTITIRNDDEATEEYLMEQIIKTSHSRIRSMSRLSNSSSTTNNSTSQQLEREETIGSTYKKTDFSSDITLDRKSFWQRQEEEEKERLLEEKKRAAEKQAQFERERKSREELEAKKLAETIKERDRLIEATRKAERHDSPSSGSQPSSILSTNNTGASNDDDDDRVGRRSELIRLERNQETQSLISKGLIKNKRAIFEQAASLSSNQPPPQSQSNLTRRASGVMITQRLNSLKSFENTSINTTTNASNMVKDVDKLSNGVVEKVIISSSSGDNSESKGVIKKEVETIKITNNEIEQPKTTITTHSETSVLTNGEKEIEKHESKKIHASNPVFENGVTVNHNNNNSNLNNNNNNSNKDNETAENVNLKETPNKSSKVESDTSQNEAEYEQTNMGVSNGGFNIKAKALYDYQASDKTEISFDPDDIIGYIEKVDKGWWHGTVITGTFKGQIGLFPSNYVEEL